MGMSRKAKVAVLVVLLGVAAGAWWVMNRAAAHKETTTVAETVQTNAAACALACGVTTDVAMGGTGEDGLAGLYKPTGNDPNIPKGRQVLLANRRIAIATGRSFPKKFCATQTPTVRGTAPYVVICELPVSRDMRIRAVANGARVVGFLPNNALLVEADAQALKNLEEDVLFLAAVEYEPTDKLQRALLGTADARVKARAVLLNSADVDAVRKLARENGCTLMEEDATGKSVSALMPRAFVSKLAGRAEVKWIERCK